MSESLFHEFDAVSAKAWKQKIQVDLKGREYASLLSQTPEHITLKPFYHPEDVAALEGAVPQRSSDSWMICERIYAAKEEKANQQAKEALEKGAESIHFRLHSKKTDLTLLFSNLPEEGVTYYLEGEFLSEDFTDRLGSLLQKHNFRVHVMVDIIGHLNKEGNWYYNQKKDLSLFGSIFTKLQNIPGVISNCSVDMTRYLNSGATGVQQLAYAMAHVHEYLTVISEHDLGPENITPLFYCGLGNQYFMEIAKLRALRLLWSSLAAEYANENPAHILAIPGKRNKTLYDYNVNMLRTTTETMSGVLGGADSITSLPYDAIYHKDNEFGSRIARNQLLILKHESYFDAVNNPASGSYFVESLTEELAQKALEIFKQIEAGGGFISQLMDQTIQRKIREAAKKEQEAFDREQRVLIGSNVYPNAEDRMKQELELDPFLNTQPRKTLVEPIIEKRLAENLEKKRLKEEPGS